MKFADLKAEYAACRMDKQTFLRRMHEMHRRLFEYRALLRGTALESITVTEDRVLMRSKDGVSIVCDEDDERIAPIEILNLGSYEREMFDMTLKLIGKNQTVFDVGANVGWYSLHLAKLVKGVRVYSFEPIPKTYGYLAENIRLNKAGNVTAHNLGLSDRRGKLTFYYYPEGSVNASLANLTKSDAVRRITCRVTTLDDFIHRKKTGVDFIKCDVEGAELLVFKGGMRTIEKNKPVIFAEMLRKWSANFNYHPNEIIKLLGGLGYGCYTADKGGLSRFERMDEDTVETNFFFLHGKKHARLIGRLGGK